MLRNFLSNMSTSPKLKTGKFLAWRSFRITELLLVILVVAGGLTASAAEKGDILFADFEGDNYASWKVEGKAFGSGPARGTLPGQMAVEGFSGKGLVNSFSGGD